MTKKNEKKCSKQKVVATGSLSSLSASCKVERSLVPCLEQSALAIRMSFFHTFSNMKSSALLSMAVACRAVKLCCLPLQCVSSAQAR